MTSRTKKSLILALCATLVAACSGAPGAGETAAQPAADATSAPPQPGEKMALAIEKEWRRKRQQPQPQTPSTTTPSTSTPSTSTPSTTTTTPSTTTAPGTTSTPQAQPAGGAFWGDRTSMPPFGGWSGTPPVERVVAAGFAWFECGYPGNTWANATLASGGVRPFAYVNLGEISDDLWGQSGYSGPILRDSNYSSALHLVDVTDWSWQDWLVRRADYAYSTGSRGVKWDVPPDVPWGKTQSDVNAAIASVMQRIRGMHPDMKFMFNQHFDFALEYPWLVDAMETEGLFSASSYAGAYLQPWNDPWWWGPQYDKARKLHDAYGIPIVVAEYADPWSGRAQELHDAISGHGFVPYITSDGWNVAGRGLWIQPGW